MTIWTIYMIRCADNSLYTGITTDVERRFAQHEKGKGAKYLRTRRPFKLVFHRPVGNRSQASKLEYAIKQLTKAKKERIVAGELAWETLLVLEET